MISGRDILGAWLDKYPPEERSIKDKEIVEQKPRLNSANKQQAVQASLDIHGLTAVQAEQAILSFLKDCHKKALLKILIIHGKGIHSLKGAVLDQLTRRLLDASPLAWKHTNAPIALGGSGATVVYLKSYI